MQKYENDCEYLSIISPIMENEEFKKMGNMRHHNTTRLDHLLKVSYYSYKVSKSLKLDYRQTARAGLLHDYYVEEIDDIKSIKDKLVLFSYGHPKKAIENAKMITTLTEKEEDIIKCHMFPVTLNLPKYLESWIVSIVDKVLSVKEFYYKFESKAAYILDLYLILLFNNLK